MLGRRLLMSGSGGSFVGPPLDYVGLINAASSSAYNYVIGSITSADGGLTWTAAGSSTLGAGAGGSWRSTYIKDPCVVWDGSQFVLYACGFNGSNFQIGRFTASSIGGTWTEYGSNPIIGVPNDGSWRQSGGVFPVVVYDPLLSPPWKMWLTGSNAGVFTIGFLDSTDGLTWTDRGQVIGLGAGGTFNDTGMHLGCAILDGSTWYVYFAGWNSDTFRHSAYATCTDPADVATYTNHGILSGFGVRLSVGGWDWRSNVPHAIVKRGGEYRVGIDLWNPGAPTGAPTDTEEAWGLVTASSLTSFPIPTTLGTPLDDASWHSNSAENPTFIAAP